MYEDFFGLTEAPFNQSPDPQFFFSSATHTEAVSKIRQGIALRKGFIIITGEVGTGKTTLCRRILADMDPNVRTALVLTPSLTAMELLRTINEAFGLPNRSDSKKELIDGLYSFLLATLKSGGNAALLIDEAQHLSVDCLEEIRLLSNLETTKEKLLQVILLGQPELAEKLRRMELRQLAQRVGLWCHLVPLELDETDRYIATRLGVAGGTGKVRFTPDAAKRVYVLTLGIPRLINALCDRALEAAAREATTEIGDVLVDEASRELEGMYRALDWRGRADADAPLYQGRAEAPGLRQPPQSRRVSLSWVALSVLVVAGVLGALYWLSPTWKRVNDTLDGGGKAPPPAAAPVVKIPEALYPKPRTAAPQDSPSADIAKLKEVRLAATRALLQQWGYSAKFLAAAGTEPNALIRQSGLQSAKLPVDWTVLERLDYPCLLDWKETADDYRRTVALLGLSKTEAVIADPLVGRRVVAREELSRYVEGEALILWKTLPGVRVPLRAKKGKEVSALQLALKKQGLLAGPATGTYDADTRAAVTRLQRQYGLKETGVFGVRTYMALSKAALGAKAPSLKGRAAAAAPPRP